MRTLSAIHWVFCLGFLIGLVGCATARHEMGGSATIEFVEPEKYSDIQLRDDVSGERARASLLPDLERYLEKQAPLHIPAGHTLNLRITNIDEAGWIRPTGPRPPRIVRTSQPARADFEYTLADASGKTVDSGRETLSDFPGDWMDRSANYETLPMTKRMLTNWMLQIGRHALRKSESAKGS